jgi:hypothetical protein
MTNIHNQVGNVQFRDGHVAMLDSGGLRQALAMGFDDNGTKHLTVPR